ncbi:DUF5979 domain-containing protein [Cellulosimicrobium cellulans]|uniref:DUF5979 domain-containing protein n=1 Tax=Cellulosimicrobium cellulans TaxID=1710 RepID=UPI001F05AE20|nr:DUF5979 domain-containing protein [Cellulosimicrobium cellulans]
MAVPLAVASTVPATAAESDPQYLEVSKRVDHATLSPGDVFTYSVGVTCSETTCLDAVLEDALPAELAGFAIQAVRTTNGPAYDVSWTEDGQPVDQPAVVGPATAVRVAFRDVTPDGSGLTAGATFTLTLTLQVPDDVRPGETDIVNTARTTATNSAPDSASATVHLSVPVETGVDLTKTWDPASRTFEAGASSSVVLSATNTSNTAVGTLVVTEPQAAQDGAPALDPSSPFTITDLTALTASPLPEGATSVQVDAYVRGDGGTWTWVTGVPATGANLPAGVDPAAVGGIRLTYAGEIVPGATATARLDLAQRATDRDGTDLSAATHVVDNVAVATATVEGHDPVSATASAQHRVTPAHVGVEVVKDITPARISAGESATATITATSASDVPVRTLTVTDRDYFTDGVVLGGFRTFAWPDGAESAEVVLDRADGSTTVVTLAPGETPTVPGTDVTGFSVTFTGAIAPRAAATLVLDVVTTEDATGDAVSRATTNTATAQVVAPNGQDATAEATDALELVRPSLEASLDKTIRPGTAVEPGARVVTGLAARVVGTSEYVSPRTLVVEDVWAGDAGEFWDAFDLAGVAPTQVPTGASLTVEAIGPDGAPVRLAAFPAQDGPFLAELTADDLAAALPAGVAPSDLTGIRFVLESTTGLPVDASFTPYVVTQARGTLRSGGDVTERPDEAVAFENTATVRAEGVTRGGTTLTDDAEDSATARVVTHEGTGPVGIDKSWLQGTVASQSGEQRSTALDWRVREGFASVTISDPAGDPADVAGTVFDAFDLVRVAPVDASSVPFSTGWYLRYDTVTAVELFVDGTWTAVAAPAGGWVQGGRFVGHTLTDEQRAAATGVRLVLAENTAAREAARQPGAALDPYAPAPGTGVAASSSDRRFVLDWQVRSTTRATGDWVTQETPLNGDDPGTVVNTAGIEALPAAGGDPARDTDSATISLVDHAPGVAVTKSASPTQPVLVPRDGSDAARPTATFTVQAQSTSVSRASFVRVTDPAACSETTRGVGGCQTDGTAEAAVADPFAGDVDWLAPGGVASPFDRYDVTAVRIDASLAHEVDLSASTAWVLHRTADGAFVSERTTAADLVSWGPERLADVVGVSVTFQGSDPATTGGTISAANRLTLTLDTVLRTHVRSTGEPLTLRAGETVEVTNRAFAQSSDPVLAPGARTGDLDDARVVLTGGDINVAPTKSVSPASLTEPARRTPVTVTLGADSGTGPVSTLAPAEVWLRDDVASSPEFWDVFAFTGLGALTAPRGADRVTVDVYGPFGADGGLAWAEGAPAPVDAPVLPVSEDAYPDVQGVRVVFSRADGGFFSTAVPAPAWEADAAFTAVLRDTHRSSGDPVVLDGSVDNTVTVRSDRLNGEASPERSTSATISLSQGTRELAVRKLANEGDRTVAVGSAVPWDLTFTNTGTGYLTLTELRDVLPATLVHPGDPAPSYATSEGGLLSTDVALAVDGRDLVLTWPEDGRVMAPGETFRVRLFLELQPGLTTGQRATNQMTVRTEEPLETCSGIDGAATTPAWGSDPRTCGTTDFVAPVDGPNLYSVKGVRGAVDGATNPSAPAAECRPTLEAAGSTWYRTPCVANSVVGGTDDWVLHVVNAGTTPVEEMVLFEQLPTAGDRMLVTGASRGSTYRPVLAGMPSLIAPDGTTAVVEVTTSPDVCAGTWRDLATQAVCEQNGETWAPADDATDWSAVTGLRVTLDFRTTADGRLDSGEVVDVTYSTVNRMASDTTPGGVAPVVPSGPDVAWNQFGVKWRYTGETTFERFAPSQVGVALPTGAVRVDKQVTGDAAGYAPGAFPAEVVCTVDGVTLDLGDAARLLLTAEGGLTARVDGVPVGAECVVTESGELGAHGETTRTGSPATVAVDVASSPQDEVPAAQVVTLGNGYAFSGLSVTKEVDTEATQEELGPFDFTLVCTTATGAPVTFDAAGTTELRFTIGAGETFTAPEGTIPARATCVVTETTADAPQRVVVTGDGVTDHGDGSADVLVGTTPAEVVVHNGYDAGVVRVTKEVDGAGAAAYGAGPFGFDIVCTRDGRTVLEEAFDLDAGASRTFGTFVVGTECVVEETTTGGATRSALAPADGRVVVTGPSEGETVSEAVVTATNTFDVADLEVVKTVEGAGAELWGTGPFEAQAVCTWDVDGETRTLVLPGDGRLALTAAGGYRAAVHDLPVGAECVVTETRTGGATTTATSADGAVVVGGEEPAVVTLTNTFDVASLDVTKRVEGALDAPGADGPFTVRLVCTREVDGETVPLDVPGGSVRELRADETVTFADLPVDAACTVEETGTGGAAATRVSVSTDERDTSVDGTTADLAIGATGGTVVVTNVFEAPVVPPADTQGAGQWLATTGARTVGAVGLAVLLLLVGGSLVALRRRGRSAA